MYKVNCTPKATPPKLVIIGANETAERILVFCERYNLYDVVGFAVDRKYIKSETFHNRPVWAIEELDEHIDRNTTEVFVALFWNHLNGDRRRLYERIKLMGYSFANIISPLASVRGRIGENCWLMDYVVIQEGALLGNNVFCADFVFIGNMAIVEDHVFCAPKCTLMGSSVVGEQSFIGTGAYVFDVVHIGRKCLVGACTIQKYDLPERSVSKILTTGIQTKQYSEDIIESK